MSDFFQVSLGANELIARRPFTHIDHIKKDRQILVHMARKLNVAVENHWNKLGKNGSINIPEPDGRSHRYFVPGPKRLLNKEKVYLVGFFGHKQERASYSHFGDNDQKLIEQLPSFREILSYSTMALPGGDFSNLVLLTNEEIKLKWAQGKTHNQAVALSSDYYQFVRINNGILQNGIQDPEALKIIRVKYFDYMNNPQWKAIRELEPDYS